MAVVLTAGDVLTWMRRREKHLKRRVAIKGVSDMDDYEIDQIYRHLRSYGVDEIRKVLDKIENMKEVDMVIGDRAIRVEQNSRDFEVWKKVVVRKGDGEGWRSTIRKILLDEMRESERGIIVVGGKLGESYKCLKCGEFFPASQFNVYTNTCLDCSGDTMNLDTTEDLSVQGNDQKKTHNAGIHALDSLETSIRSIVKNDPVDMTELNTAFVDLRRWMIMVVERLCRVEGGLQIIEGAHMNYCNSDENEFEHRHGSLPPAVKDRKVKDLQERIKKLKRELKTIVSEGAGVDDSYPFEWLRKCPEPGCELWCGTPTNPSDPNHRKQWYCSEHGWFEPE